RTGVAEGSGGDQPIRHPDRNFGPADAPGRAGGVPPDPAPAVLKAHQRIIGARRGDSERDCQHGKSKAQSFHRGASLLPSPPAGEGAERALASEAGEGLHSPPSPARGERSFHHFLRMPFKPQPPDYRSV